LESDEMNDSKPAETSPQFTTIQELREWLRREYPWTQFVAEDQFEEMVAKLYETRIRS
jgi:hypothetical protein